MKLNELKAEIARKEMTIDVLADKAKIKRGTMYRRFSNTGGLTLSEIKSISDVLEINGDRIMEIFFDEKVS